MSRSKLSPAVGHVSYVIENCVVRNSRQRYNQIVQTSLFAAVEDGMRFEPGDFSLLAAEYGMGRWIGDGGIEWIYGKACGRDRGVENPSAVAAVEKYTGREPFSWAQDTKTPKRLYVGAQFTWKGERVTVTSFNDEAKTLTACSYSAESYGDDSFMVGAMHYQGQGKYRKIEAVADLGDGTLAVRYAAPTADDESRTVVKRFTISAAELREARLDYERRRKAHARAFASATTGDELAAARLAASGEGAEAYRHFDLEILKAAYETARERVYGGLSFAEREKLDAARYLANMDRWAAGEDVRDYLGNEIRIRVKGGFVEVSNGNKVSIRAAKAALAFVAEHRSAGWTANGERVDLDAFPLRRVGPDGVQVGCTLIPWAEVDRCSEMLKAKP